MLNIYSDEAQVPHYTFFAIMSHLGKVFVSPSEYKKLLSWDSATARGYEELMLDYMRFYADYEIPEFKPSELLAFLIHCENVPEKLLQVWDSKKKSAVLSTDINIIKRVYEQGYAQYLLGIYINYQAMNSKKNFLASQAGALCPTEYKSSSGEQLNYIPFYYTLESTGRIYTHSVDLQGLSHKYDTIYEPLEDYFFLWGDFSQIDLRVALELCLASDKRLKDNILTYDDRYEAFARTITSTDAFDLDKFKHDRQYYKAGILAPIYGQAKQGVINKVGNDEIGTGIYNYINSNPKYIAYQNNVQRNIESGVDYYCTTYFGFHMPISQLTNNKFTSSLNKPIQGTSGDIMKIVTTEIYNRMQKHLKNKSAFIPFLNRHDESIFMVHKSAIPFLYEFLDCTRIQIDDWGSLQIEWGAGYKYGQPDEGLMLKINATVENHPLTPAKPRPRMKPYHATPIVFILNWSKLHYGNITFNLFWDFYSGKQLFLVYTNSLDYSKLYKVLQESFEKDFDMADRIILYNQDNYYIPSLNGKEFIITMPEKRNNYEPDRLNMYLASAYMKKNLNLEPVQEWVQQGYKFMMNSEIKIKDLG